jgi:hypothetical protein
MRKLLVIGFTLVFLTRVVVVAQEQARPATGVAKIIQINREDIKIGRTHDHDNFVGAVRRANTSSKSNYHWIAARTASGNTSENIFFAGFDSYAELEKSTRQFEGAFRTAAANADVNRDNIETHLSKRGIIAKLREDLSYNADKIRMKTIRVKPGTSGSYGEMMKAVVDLHRKGGINEQWAVYEVAFGANTPTFMVFTPLKSVADLDDTSLKAAHEEVFNADTKKTLTAMTKDAILTEEATLLRISPDISNPEPQFVAANPSFWTVKETDTVVAKTKTRKSAVEPASLKKQ